MRTILEFTAYGEHLDDAILKSVAEYGWNRPDLGINREELVELAQAVIVASDKARRDLPISPESQFIQDAINNKFGKPGVASQAAGGSTGGANTSRFGMFTYERNCLEQAVLILTQIARDERTEAYQRNMTVISGPEFSVYGIMFSDPAKQAGNSATYQTRLRCNDLARLQTATTSFLSALNPGSSGGSIRRYTSRAASVGRRQGGVQPFISDIRRIEIRSVSNEQLFRGKAIPITNRFSLIRHTLSDHSARLLGGLSLLLIGVSAIIYAVAPDSGWWLWSEQLVGRLATGAFGALLVDSALDYSALRRSITGGTGAVTHGAMVDWTRV
ncbi:hypothetical protein [Paracoccus sp. (in: a-proteobacteria)]|uniref:hypothetical protein n=1 Tax=Paracoccus sp. TaxID=267 RepID=UPI0032205A71